MGAPAEAAGELEVEFRGEREEILVCLENATIICFDGFGGPARAAKLSKAELSKIGKKAAAARWDHPKATHAGELKFGEIAIPCAVLEDGRRVVSQRGFYKGLGGKSVPTKTLQADPDLPAFLSAKTLQPFISDRLKLVLKTPIKYRIDGVKAVGGGIAHGIPAEVIPDICDVYQQAKEAGGLHYRQEKLALNAYAILRALGHVGIVALVDEATGYQAVRERDALHQILAEYINEELMPWSKRFPDEFYVQMFRLREWDYDLESGKSMTARPEPSLVMPASSTMPGG